jgi:hypothetical protein
VPKTADKIPGWVERLLIPTLGSKVRSIVSEEVGHLEKVLDARFDGVHSEIRRVDERIGSLEQRIDERICSLEKRFDERMGSLEKRFPEVQEIAEITARLSQVESQVSSR